MDNIIIKINKSNYGISYILKCLNCGRKFKVKKFEYDKGRYKYYCSRKCKSEARTEKVKCLTCKKEFKVSKSRKAKYCSRKCAVVISKRKKTIEHKTKIANAHIGMKASDNTKKKLSKIRIKLYKEHPEKHPNRIMAKNGFISNPQKEMYELIRNVYSDAKLEYPIITSNGMKYADVAILKLKIVTEYDGEYWHKGNELKDLIRQKAIEKEGWKVLRFNKNNYKDCLKIIKNTYKAKQRKMI